MTPPDSGSILSLFQLTDDQYSAATARDVAISVTAGAGSGKTRALAGRFLALLEAGLPLRSLVAITFTDKAAREMRNRIRAITTSWLANEGAVANQELWAEAFSALDSARISTIHGLCAVILRTHPAEAGLDPAFSVLDEGQSAVWRARAVEAGLIWISTEPEVVHLFDIFQEGQLRQLLANLLGKRLDVAQILAESTADLLTRWASMLDQWLSAQLTAPLWQDALETLASVQATKQDDKLEIARQSVLKHWAEARQAQANGEWDAHFESLLALRQSMLGRGGQKGNWAGDDLAETRAAMGDLRTHFDQVVSRLLTKKRPLSWALDCQIAELLPLVHQAFQQTQSIYQGYKNEAHTLDFDDLEQMTAQLLTNNETVRLRWQQEINAILLVDEFQDTNQRQREIVYALAGFEPKPTKADSANGKLSTVTPSMSEQRGELEEVASNQKVSSLFVVGDAKQSIYRFRGADVTVFRQVQADIKQAGGALINFDLTFRAHQALVELTNALLAPLMIAKNDSNRPYDVPFAPLTAYRTESSAGMQPPYLEFQIGLGADKQAGRLSTALGLTHRLQELHDAGQLEWQDVALLFRASTAFGVYEDALEQAGIPYVTIAGRGFFDRPEVRDLLNILAAIADPTDDLAMAGLLRSPAIGLSDGAIHLLRWHDQQRRSFWMALQNLVNIEGLTDDDRIRANFTHEVVTNLHQQAGRITVAQLLKNFLDVTHYRAALRLVPGGERLRRNIDKLLADAHRSGLISVAEFLEYVATLGDVGARESEAPTEAGGAVQLMTIHKAKGLEFPVVVLADAGYTGGYRTAPLYLDQELGLLLKLSAENTQPAAYRLAAWREAEQEAAEERRLLYVAATRAMEKFIISGDAKLSTAKSSTGQLLFGGWLKNLVGVVGLAETRLAEMPTSAQTIPMGWESGPATCTIYPPAKAVPEVTLANNTTSSAPSSQTPDLLAPLAHMSGSDMDEKLRERESSPPPRVWRVVSHPQDEVPAWVVGSLTHTALRYWRFPHDGPASGSENGFAEFLRPFALEAGLTDQASLDIALHRVGELLTRFQAHPLYSQLSAAERHHEVPYSVTLAGETHSGLIDLLFRSSPTTAWSIAEFKTDRLAGDVDLRQHIQNKGYDRQVENYRQAVSQQLGTTPRILLIFLNVGRSVQELVL